jgi:hypothetical protein
MRYLNGFDTLEQAEMAFHETFPAAGTQRRLDSAAKARWKAALNVEETLLEKVRQRSKVAQRT